MWSFLTDAPRRLSALVAVLAFLAGGSTVWCEQRTAPPATADPPAEAKAPPSLQVVATYFHTTRRCATCQKLETYSREVVERQFPKELADGRLVFRALNVELEENRHFIRDYSLVSKSLVLVDVRDGRSERWENLPRIWQLVGDRPKFEEYVAGAIRRHLAGE